MRPQAIKMTQSTLGCDHAENVDSSDQNGECTMSAAALQKAESIVIVGAGIFGASAAL